MGGVAGQACGEEVYLKALIIIVGTRGESESRKSIRSASSHVFLPSSYYDSDNAPVGVGLLLYLFRTVTPI